MGGPMKLTRFHCLLGVAATAAALLAGCASSSEENGIKRYKSVQEEEASRKRSRDDVEYLPPPEMSGSTTKVVPMGVVVLPIRNSRGEYVIPPQKGTNAPAKNGDRRGTQRR